MELVCLCVRVSARVCACLSVHDGIRRFGNICLSPVINLTTKKTNKQPKRRAHLEVFLFGSLNCVWNDWCWSPNNNNNERCLLRWLVSDRVKVATFVPRDAQVQEQLQQQQPIALRNRLLKSFVACHSSVLFIVWCVTIYKNIFHSFFLT
jgi:hypothetical protein